VGFIILGHEFVYTEVRVSLSGRQADVAQHLLHSPKVSSGIQQVRGKAMPESVRAEWPTKIASPHMLLHEPGNASGAEPATAVIEKEGSVLRPPGQQFPPPF
jgi:hypothetical protein